MIAADKEQTFKRLLTYAFSENRSRPDQLQANYEWRLFVVLLPVLTLLGAGAYAGITVIGSGGETASGQPLEALDVLMLVIGCPALVWFALLSSHFLGLFWWSSRAAARFVAEHDPANKKRDPDVENVYRIRTMVRQLSGSFGRRLVVPLGTVCVVGVCLTCAGMSDGSMRGKAGPSGELLALGCYFVWFLQSLVGTGGKITASVERVFRERNVHTLEMLKGFEGRFKMELLGMSSSTSTNDFLGTWTVF